MSFRRASKHFGKYVIWLVIIGFGLGVIVLFTPNLGNTSLNPDQQEQKEPALLINGQKISRADFEQAYANLLQNYARFYSQFGQDFNQRLQGPSGGYYQLQLRSQVADQLIRQTLIQQQEKEKGIRADRARVEAQFKAQFNQILNQNNLTEQQADEILRAQGSSLREFKKRLREQIESQLKEERLKEVVSGEIRPTDEELLTYIEENKGRYLEAIAGAQEPSEEDLRKYYDEHSDEFLQVRARHILIELEEDAPEEEVQAARERIEEVRRLLEEGADFAELAKEYSEGPTAPKGGDLGYFGRGAMVKEFEEVAFSLEPGQLSDPVRTPFGFHIIKVEDRKVQPFDEVRSQIQAKYTESIRDRAFADWLERAKGGDNEALDLVRDRATQDYIKEERDRLFEDWYKEIKAKADIQIKLPLIAAYRLEASDREGALAEYERIRREGLSTDPYLDYYIGRLYQQKLSEAQSRQKELQEVEERTPEEESELQELEAQIAEYREKAAESLLATVTSSTGSGGDLSLFEEVLKLGKDSASVRYQYALALMGQNRSADAITQLKKALEQDEDYVPALVLYADMMMNNKNFRIASEHYEKALAAASESRTAQSIRVKLARAYLGLQEYNKAQALFEEVLQTDERNSAALTGLGDLYFEQADYESAERYYQDALKAAARADVRVKLGRTYLEAGKLDQAQTAFEMAQKSAPYNVDTYLGLGETYEALGKTEQALEQYKQGFRRAGGYEQRATLGEKVLALDPTDLATRLRLAELYKDQHVFEAAIRHYNAILEQDPHSVTAYLGLGDSYTGRTKYEEAKAYYKSALELVPAPTLEEKLKLYRKVFEAERSIVGFNNKLGPDGLDALYNLAALNLEKGDLEEAKRQLERLEEQDPDYRRQDVAALKWQIEDREEARPGRRVELQGREHVERGASHPPYNSTPPTSGWHYDEEAEWGIHREPIEDELQVHNLEHGGVLIQYSPQADPDLVQQLEGLARELGPDYPKLIVAPYPGLESEVALTAWGRIDTFDTFNAQRIRAFVKAYHGRGPEVTTFTGPQWWSQEEGQTEPETESEGSGDDGQS